MITAAPNTNEISNRDIAHFLKYCLLLLNARIIPAAVIKTAEVIIIPLVNSRGYTMMYYSLTLEYVILSQTKEPFYTKDKGNKTYP
ncbi:MAG: hypothetical protein KAV87_08205 [Desulfobacteraceae bacterium]|nr:hypothetical protein [Desulfobacteraceae bacterium]